MGISKPLLVELWRLMEKCSANDLRRVFLVYVQVPLSNLTDPARGLEAVRTDVIEWLLLQDEGTVEAFLTGLHAVKPRAGFDAFALRLLGRPQSAAAAPPLVPPGAPVVKTVLALNMAGYGAVARQREETGGPAAVKALDERIQAFISDGLKAVGSAHDRALVRDTGDGAILVFDDPNAAHHFAVAVYAALTAPGNDGGTVSPYRFRMGAATGAIVLEWRDGWCSLAGATVADAVRLQSAAAPGTLLVDLATFRGLDPNIRARYADEETVPGKREEPFAARRYVLNTEDAETEQQPVAAATGTPPAGGDRREIVKLFGQLFPPQRLDTLMFLLEMPVGEQPPDTIPYDARWNRVLTWVSGRGAEGLVRLETELRWLIAGGTT